MTSHSDDDPLARDPRFDRLWREASAEEPPSALDDALRAAARRAVDAGPQRAARAVKEATRPERWWFPLAAAATIGAIAFGLLQIVGLDRLAGESAPGGVVSDLATPAAPPRARTPAPVEPPPAAVAPPTPAPQAPVAAAPAGTLPSAPAKPARSTVSVGAPKPTAGRSEPPRVAAAAASAERSAMPAAVPVPAPQPHADAARPPAAEAAADVVTPRPALTPAPAPSPAPAAAAARAPEPFPGALAKEEQRRSAPATARALLAAPAGGTATGTAAPLPVPEWIALIRRLRDEGRLDDARRELVAFRKAHPDHAQLLPPDLRDWAVEGR